MVVGSSDYNMIPHTCITNGVSGGYLYFVWRRGEVADKLDRRRRSEKTKTFSKQSLSLSLSRHCFFVFVSRAVVRLSVIDIVSLQIPNTKLLGCYLHVPYCCRD